MALPDRLPEPPEGFENHQADGRPDWLVGAEEGAQSEIHRDDGLEGNAPTLEGRVLPMPELRRPAPKERIGLPLESRPAPVAASPPPPRTVAWSGVGNSVPRLTQTPEGEVRSAFVAPDPDDDHEIEPIPDNDTGLLSVSLKTSGPTITTHSTLQEPWWVVFGERITGDRRILIGIGTGVLVVVAALAFWPRTNASVRLQDIRKNPDQWEGRSVKVSGRVGDDVFPLGSGYVFPLLQGRDTIVVFTRTRTPERRQRVTVIGEVSAGYLDGRARLAILENPTP
jgi:hypothetical protein